MLGSDAGIERDERQKAEILNFPYVYSDSIVQKVEEIQSIIVENQKPLTIQHDLSDLHNGLNKIILEELGLTGNEFVDYALNMQIPLITKERDKGADAVRKVTERDLKTYGRYFNDYLSEIYKSSRMYIQINIYPTVTKYYSAFEVLVLDEQPNEQFIVVNDNETRLKSMFVKLASSRRNELFYELKDVLIFEEDSFCIIKPNYYRNWHPAMARLDLMEVTEQILSDSDGNGGVN
jgi:hypothetical protein